MGINTNNIYNDWRGGLYTVGGGSDFLVAGNKMWGMLQDANRGHRDTYYLMTGGIFYNNILRDIFPGTAAFYIETGDGSIPAIGYTSYVFNNVAWNIGTSTPPIGWSSEFTNSGARSVSSNPNLFAYNNSFYAYSGTSDCSGFFPRFGHALVSTLTGRHGQDGHTTFSFPQLVSPYVGTMTALAWYPQRYGVEDGFRMGNFNLLGQAGGNLALEFIYGGPHTLLSRLRRSNSPSGTAMAQNP
jgi:hypothetical protein